MEIPATPLLHELPHIPSNEDGELVMIDIWESVGDAVFFHFSVPLGEGVGFPRTKITGEEANGERQPLR